MNPENNPNNSRKKIIWVISVVLIVVSIVSVILLLGKDKTYEYQVLVDPPDTVLTIDGQPAQPGLVKLSEGEHTLKATRDLFEDAVVVVNTKDLIPGQEIFVLPKAVSPEAIKYLEELSDTTGITEKIGAAVVAERATAIAERYPVTQQLPYDTIDFEITYTVNEQLEITYAIALYPYAGPDNPGARIKQLKQFKTAALQFLQEKGVDTNAATITYTPTEASQL